MSKMRLLTLVILFFFTFFLTYAQGVKSDDQPRIKVIYQTGSKSGSEIKLEDRVDLKPFCPIPKNQGLLNSCIGWAMGYGAMSVAFAIKQNWRDQNHLISEYAFSPLYPFLSNVKNTDCDKVDGLYLDSVADFLNKRGDIKYSDFDLNHNNCTTVQDIQNDTFLHYKIKQYNNIFDSNTPGSLKTENTKISLMENKPVVISLSIFPNFLTIGNDDLFWHPNIGNMAYSFNHAMLVVGYDDIDKHAFEIMNSHGDGWGNKGFLWVKYRDFEKYAKRGLNFDTDFQEIKNKQGRSIIIKFNSVTEDDRDSTLMLLPYAFEPDHPYCYTLKDSVPIGSYCQISLEGDYSGLYLYAFNIESGGLKQIIYPLDGEPDDIFSGKAGDEYLPYFGIKKILPSERKVFYLKNKGLDYHVLFFSKYIIKNFSENLLFNALAYNRLKMDEVLTDRMSERIAPPSEIQLINNSIVLKCPLDNMIIPVILKIPIKQ